jgi:RNA polymerase sigma-70 factor, ECF subfamily
MPVQRKTIYQLSRTQGLSNDEIASQLGIAKKTVENQLSLALQELRRIVQLFLIFFM